MSQKHSLDQMQIPFISVKYLIRDNYCRDRINMMVYWCRETHSADSHGILIPSDFLT